MLTHRTFDREAVRLACWILCMVIAAGFASCWTHGGNGAADRALARGRRRAGARARCGVRSAWSGLPPRARIILFAAMVATLLIACGFGSPPAGRGVDGDRGRRCAIHRGRRSQLGLAGWAFHAAMSAKARLWRLLSLAYSSLVASAPQPRTSSFERQEPNLGGRAAPAIGATGRRRFRRRGGGRRGNSRRPRPAQKAAPRAPLRKSSDKFELPSVSVLTSPKASDRQPLSKSELEAHSRGWRRAGDFGVRGEIVKANPGPVVTLYELEPAPGIKSSPSSVLPRHRALDERASARVAVVPGRQCHRHRIAEPASRTGLFARIAGGQGRQRSGGKTPAFASQTSAAKIIIIDLARTPHMLIAGTTGSGKSVAINTMILSLSTAAAGSVPLIMVDPKMPRNSPSMRHPADLRRRL